MVTKVQKSSGSIEALSLARAWLQSCRENHPLCESNDDSSEKRLPMRVVDTRGLDESKVYLRESRPDGEEYAALSYCWGPESPGLFTKTDNSRSYQEEGVAIHDLPPTIRDAVYATRELGLRYLWVDRLCIIQDSTEDWTKQAALMCDIYSGAALTFSANGSGSAVEGLFRQDQSLSALTYQAHYDSQGNQTPFLLHRPQAHPNLESRATTNEQPIDQRAWTFQERLMSRRVLHFTTDELVWECSTMTECECRRQSDTSHRALSPASMRNIRNSYDHWMFLVRSYTKRSLSQEMDKLPAFRGLVAKFRQAMKSIEGGEAQDEYFAGLWKRDLAAQLAWMPPTPADLKAFMKTFDSMKAAEDSAVTSKDDEDWFKIVNERNRREDWHRSEGYVAPSWSWAHLHGPISYMICHPPTPFKSYIDILDTKVVPMIPQELTGRVASGSITLSGFMIRDMQLNIMQCGYEGGFIKDLSALTYGDDGEFWIELEPDDVQTVLNERGCDSNGVVLLLLGTKDFSAVEGAVVTGLSPPRRMSRKPKSDPNGDVEMAKSTKRLPEELTEAFFKDQDDIRWSFYLVLAESKTNPGNFERLGCFEVWSPEVDVMAELFIHSIKDSITII